MLKLEVIMRRRIAVGVLQMREAVLARAVLFAECCLIGADDQAGRHEPVKDLAGGRETRESEADMQMVETA
jgi:hypothetical protein